MPTTIILSQEREMKRVQKCCRAVPWHVAEEDDDGEGQVGQPYAMSYEYRWALLHPASAPLGMKFYAFAHGPFWVLKYVLVAIGYTIKPWKFLKSWA